MSNGIDLDDTDHSPLVSEITGRKSLVKPPWSVCLRLGSVTLQPGDSVGVHRTASREEAIIVLSGTATVDCAGQKLTVPARHLAYIPSEQERNVINQTDQPVVYVYVVTPIGTESEHIHGDGPHVH